MYQGKVEKVRLIGVDTPPGYKEATAFTTRMVEGKTIRLEFDGPLRDPYGRLFKSAQQPTWEIKPSPKVIGDDWRTVFGGS